MALELLPWALFALSLAIYPFLFFYRRRHPPRRNFDLTAQDLLHDLTRRGSALVKIDVVDTANLLLRSPRR